MTLGSNPPTYNARLFGSGAARRMKLLVADPGDPIPEESPSAVIAVGLGLLFCGITTGGSGGGGMWAGLLCPLVVVGSYCCWPGAPTNVGGGGSDMAVGPSIAVFVRYKGAIEVTEKGEFRGGSYGE